ncbi:unnamed protein product [Malus baccata var. baccata]
MNKLGHQRSETRTRCWIESFVCERKSPERERSQESETIREGIVKECWRVLSLMLWHGGGWVVIHEGRLGRWRVRDDSKEGCVVKEGWRWLRFKFDSSSMELESMERK